MGDDYPLDSPPWHPCPSPVSDIDRIRAELDEARSKNAALVEEFNGLRAANSLRIQELMDAVARIETYKELERSANKSQLNLCRYAETGDGWGEGMSGLDISIRDAIRRWIMRCSKAEARARTAEERVRVAREALRHNAESHESIAAMLQGGENAGITAQGFGAIFNQCNKYSAEARAALSRLDAEGKA